MADQVHIYPKIERQLAQLSGQTNAPAVAAQRARQIIAGLIRGETPACWGAANHSPGDGDPDDDPGASPALGPALGLMRARQDRRVKNSLKFNLGQGFRLICIKEKRDIYVMFVGDHDSCDAWLDHHTRKKPHKTELQMQVVSVDPACTKDKTVPHPPEETLSCDPLLAEIPQEVLRRVFSGLCAAG